VTIAWRVRKTEPQENLKKGVQVFYSTDCRTGFSALCS
jgi:hypothetical protein